MNRDVNTCLKRWQPLLGHGLAMTIALTLALVGTVARAERHALLVGVSGYPSLDAARQLQGPRNDVLVMRAVLEQRGFPAARIQVLADGVRGAGDPTRSAILGALDRLAVRARTGDYVFLYFAGHGSQQPVATGSAAALNEPDGLHEIFLPRDVGRWNGRTGTVEQAIVDHELVARLDAIRSRGAFVWAVFDTCHAATLMRGGTHDAVRYRHVAPADLGVPRALIDAALTQATLKLALTTRGGAQQGEAPLASTTTQAMRMPNADTSRSGAEQGGFVAFYAAQTTELTPELPLPAGSSARKPYGLFGFTLAQALATSDAVSYRQLAQQVLTRYAAQNQVSPTPMFTGDALDAPVFGTVNQPAVRQWPLTANAAARRFDLPAGYLAQLAPGQTLAIVASPMARNEDTIGYARVTSADVFSATLVPIAQAGRPALAFNELPAGAYARVVDAPLNLTLRVQAPAHTGRDAARVMAALQAIDASRSNGLIVQWVKPQQERDLRLMVDGGRLWLLGPTGPLVKAGPARTHSLVIDAPDFASRLTDTLQRIGKTLNLLRIAEQLEGGERPRQLEITLALRHKDGSLFEPAAAALPVPWLVDGDRVELVVRNRGLTAIDLTALYVDGEYGISVLYPHQAGSANRIEAGGSDTLALVINDETVGIERLVMIAVQARQGAERQDFSFLAQARLERTRGQAQDDLLETFAAAGFGPQAATVRGGKPLPPPRTEMKVLTWQVRGQVGSSK